jgi:hypothetical protein
MGMIDITDDERRRSPRFRAQWPVELGVANGLTENLSLTGVFFQTNAPISAGDDLSFVVVVAEEGQLPVRLHCTGRVVRAEQRGSLAGVAATIDTFWFETIGEVSH